MASSLFGTQNKTIEQNKEQTINNSVDLVKKMVSGRNPEEVFYEECRKRGANPQNIINMAKMFFN